METQACNNPNYAFLAFASKDQLGIFATAIFERLGYFTAPGEGLSSSGIDFIIYRPDGAEAEMAMRCRPDNGQVELPEVSRFWSKVSDQGYERAVFVTNKAFSPQVQAFAEGRSLLLVDVQGLERGIDALPAEHREAVFMTVESTKGNLSKDVFAGATSQSRSFSEADPGGNGGSAGRAAVEEFSDVQNIAPVADREPEPQFDSEPEYTPGDEFSYTFNRDTEDKSKSLLMSLLTPAICCVAGFFIWKQLTDLQPAPAEIKVAPVVAEYLDKKNQGAELELQNTEVSMTTDRRTTAPAMEPTKIPLGPRLR